MTPTTHFSARKEARERLSDAVQRFLSRFVRCSVYAPEYRVAALLLSMDWRYFRADQEARIDAYHKRTIRRMRDRKRRQKRRSK